MGGVAEQAFPAGCTVVEGWWGYIHPFSHWIRGQTTGVKAQFTTSTDRRVADGRLDHRFPWERPLVYYVCVCVWKVSGSCYCTRMSSYISGEETSCCAKPSVPYTHQRTPHNHVPDITYEPYKHYGPYITWYPT